MSHGPLASYSLPSIIVDKIVEFISLGERDLGLNQEGNVN